MLVNVPNPCPPLSMFVWPVLVKLFEYAPLPGTPVENSRTLVRDAQPGDHVSSPLAPRYVTFIPAPCFTMLMICGYAAALVGLKPSSNSLVLLTPSWSGSAFGPLIAGLANWPALKYLFCHTVNGSDGVTAPIRKL